MTSKKIQKMALSLAILSTIALSSCAKNNHKENVEEPQKIEETVNEEFHNKLVSSTFTNILENKEKIFTEYSYIYDTDGNIIGGAYDSMECFAVATNGEYSLIVMKNNETGLYDGISGFVKNDLLIDKYNLINFYAYANKDLKIYCEKELINQTNNFTIKEGKMLKVLFMTDTYAAISLEDGRTTVYINANDLDLIDNLEMDNNWFNVNSYHYLAKDANLFNDTSFNNPSHLIDMYQKVFVIKSDGNWSYVLTDSGDYGYMETFLLYKLPKEVFVDVDISDQKVRLYKDYVEIFNSYDITGKDSTPTDLGYFNIFDMDTNTYLQSRLPDGSLEYNVFVNYWMQYNAGEGMHDASWQNAYFGNKDFYHNGGSHGCVNLPYNSAKIIYDKVEIGTRVLVHK